MGHKAWHRDLRRLAAVLATAVVVGAVAAFIPSVVSGVSAPYPHAPGDPTGDAKIDAGDITQIELCILYPETYPNASYAGWDANEDGEGPNSGDILTTEYIIVGTWPFNHVHIEAPDELQYCTNFTATVHLTRVEDFGSAAYEITYDAGVLEVKDVTGGQLMQKLNGGSAQFYSVDVESWGLPGGQGMLRVSSAIAGGQGATGAGYLSMIHFHVVGSACDSSGITFNETACNMSDDMGGAIAATWEGDSLHVAPEPTPSPSPTLSPTPSPSPSASPSPTPTASPTVSPTPTPSPSATYTALPTPTATLTVLASSTPSATAGAEVTVYIVAPAEVTAGTNFIASVNVTEVYHLASADYDILYDPSVLEVVDRNGDGDINNLDIINGRIGGKGFPVKGATLVGDVQGKLRVLQYLKAGGYRDGEGYLCKVEFEVVGSACDTSAITPQEIEETGSGLFRSDTTKIPATWVSDSVHGQ